LLVDAVVASSIASSGQNGTRRYRPPGACQGWFRSFDNEHIVTNFHQGAPFAENPEIAMLCAEIV